MKMEIQKASACPCGDFTLVQEAQNKDLIATLRMSGDGLNAFYQLMVEPDKYIGKTLCIDGLYYTGQNEKTGTYYHYSIIKDALACCSQGLEFVWGDVSHVYPDEYPKDETEIEVKGTFETYKEPGDDTLYCHLVNSEMQVK